MEDEIMIPLTTTRQNKKRTARVKNFRKLLEDLSSDSDESSGDDESSDNDGDDLCGVCKKMKPPYNKSKKILWIFCEECERWLHVECDGASKEDMELEKYICNTCQYS